MSLETQNSSTCRAAAPASAAPPAWLAPRQNSQSFQDRTKDRTKDRDLPQGGLLPQAASDKRTPPTSMQLSCLKQDP